MTTAAPRVTVIVTSYNQADLVSQALDSVAAQTERDLQLIVTDDGSTDGSQSTIEAWLARHELVGALIAANQNVGLPAMLNRSLPMIQGEYVVVLNGDDWMEPDRLAVQAAALDAAPDEVGLVYSDLRIVDADGVPTGDFFPPPSVERREGHVLLHIIEHPMIGIGSAMFRRTVLDQVGPWDESLVADDFDFLLRVAATGFEFRYVPATVLNYRQVATSLTAAHGAELAEGRIRALKKIFGRDRETDRVILARVHGLAIALHGLGYDRTTTRYHLRFVLRHSPSRALLRATIENQLGMPHRTLSPRRFGQRVAKRWGRAWSNTMANR